MSGVNPVRGEAALTIAGATYRLEATMDALARLAQAAGDPPLQELYQRLTGGSLHASRLALGAFVTGGTSAEGRRLNRREAGEAILRDLALTDMGAVQAAIATLLLALTRPDDGARADDGGDAAGNRMAVPG